MRRGSNMPPLRREPVAQLPNPPPRPTGVAPLSGQIDEFCRYNIKLRHIFEPQIECTLIGIPSRMQQAEAGGAAMTQEKPMRVAIGGFGAIGKVVARRLDRGIEGLTLAAVAARDVARAEAAMADYARAVPVVSLAQLAERADVVVECAPAAVLRELAEPVLARGRAVMVLSCGALLDNFDLVDLARRHGGRILVPTGALLGLDAVAAAAEGEIVRVRMTTRK